MLAWSFVSVTILWAMTAKSMPDMCVGAALGAFARYRYKKRFVQRASPTFNQARS